MLIAVASGKGGTGKSTVAANLAYARAAEEPVILADCDVEEPNLHLFFPAAHTCLPVTVPVPVIDESRCTRCGGCSDACQFGALTVLKDRTLFLSQLCHSCGACTLVCPEKAIREVASETGIVCRSRPLPGLTLVSGTLNRGEPRPGPVIGEVKREAGRSGAVILDAPPGTGCPVIETLDGCDCAILVTEPTPFGLHDLALAVELTAALHIPAGVVINRSDGHDREVQEFCRDRNIPVLMTIPFDREIATIQGSGRLLSREIPEWADRFRDLYRSCLVNHEVPL